MKTRGLITLAVIGLALTIVAPRMHGQAGAGRRAGNKAPANTQRMYDPRTVQTVTGKVASIDTIAARGRMAGGVHIELQTDSALVSVHLGPAWYLNRQGVRLEKGGAVTVTGSRILVDGKPAIVADGVVSGTATLKLRDRNGIPLWSRGPR
ncbi:MAG TPA: DNA-binding protein [Bacteroidota bacterium]|nr:DNA-binding protein [Bacteroidota bacterium]